MLENISFSVSSGEVLGIIGNNGAGKSTLLKVISKLLLQLVGKIKRKGQVYLKLNWISPRTYWARKYFFKWFYSEGVKKKYLQK